MLDPEAGTITFGNGIRGRAPQIGERIRAVEYRYGGGSPATLARKQSRRLPVCPRSNARIRCPR